MREIPEKLSDSPIHSCSAVDVIADILGTVHLITAVSTQMELGAPWHLRIPERDFLSFYVIGRGSAWLDLPASDVSNGCSDGIERTIALSAGDAVLLPKVSAHLLRDANRSDVSAVEFDYARCPKVPQVEVSRFGGDGPVTSIICGHFSFGSVPNNALLTSLPRAIHIPANSAAVSPQLAGIVPLNLNESANPGPGNTLVLARLADLLLVQGLRYWIATAGSELCGLRAVADPSIGTALRLIHLNPAEAWTVEQLASAVAMSRSGFAARFTTLVGESPLQYLAHWRMTRAARLLRESDMSIASVAQEVGYANAVAFTKAFTRIQGIGPGAYRREYQRQS